ncbi:MAG: energy transducer TonB [Acidobacteriaceae bacterium]|jgi:TonB family protein
MRLAAQTTEIEIKTRLIGRPLYLRGFWLEDQLKFGADGQPAGNLKSGTFTEAGIAVHNVKLSHGQLRIEGQRVGLEFLSTALNSSSVAPKRVSLSGPNYTGSISIEIQSPPDGDFSKALDAVFAPDLASLVPAMPRYWQDYAQKHFLDQGPKDGSKPQVAAKSDPGAEIGDKLFHVGGTTTKPVVLHQEGPQFSDAARVLKFSGMVTVYLWVMTDGSVAHLSIVKAAGLGLDEQALHTVSEYRFKPATRDGKPVTVDLYVDVNFQILDGR